MKKPNRLKIARLYTGRKTSFWNKLTGRREHRLSASVTGEGDWEVEVPQIRMSRAFAVMLVLHVIAVGGLFAYRIWGRDEEPKAGAENAPAIAPVGAEKAAAALAAIPAPQPITIPSSPSAPGGEEKTYTWHAGDSIQLIAARFGVSTSALREANPDKQLVPGAVIVLPRAGRVFGGADVADTGSHPSAIFDPQAAKSVPAGVPRAQVVPEPGLGSEVPDVIPSPGEEAGVIAKPVTAHMPAKVKPATAAPAGTKKPVKDKNTVSLEPPPPAGTIPTTTPKHATDSVRPASVVTTKPAATPAKQPARTAGQRVHVVAKGDTVYNLARKYGFTSEEIAKANDLGSGERISPGQQLKIPVKR